MGNALIGRRTSRIVHDQSDSQTKRKPRVAIITSYAIRGGVCRWIASLGKHCESVEFCGLLVTHNGPTDSLVCSEISRFMPIYCSGGHATENDKKHVTRYRAFADAAIAACQSADVLLVVGVDHNLNRLPVLPPAVVLVSHGSCGYTKKWVERCLPLSTHLAAVSDVAVMPFPSHLRKVVQVINNGAEIERCMPIIGREATLAKWNTSPDARYIGFLGRFAMEKDPGAVIRAVENLPLHYRAAFVGSGPLEPALRQACERKIPGRYVFAPFVHYVGDALASFDALVVASESEGFCYTINEAWLAHCPVASTSVGIIPQMEKQFGKMTWSIPFKSEGELIAKAVIEATSNSSKPVVDNAFDVAWRNLTAARMGHEWGEWLQQIACQAEVV